jgi:cation:H+ antiporter
MLISLALIIIGLLLLAGGGEALVRGAVAIARHAGLTPAVIGLTVVAMGTSLPELVVSVLASLRDQPDIAVGNVLGSNIANVALILGVSALVANLPIRGNVVRLEWPLMFLASAAFLVVARDGVLDRLEAGLFVVALVAFVAYSVWLARGEVTEQEREAFAAEIAGRSIHAVRREIALSLGAVLLGLGLLVAGGRMLVDGAVTLARLAGLSERVIGLTIVAVGTSAPELATSLIAAFRRQTDLAVANIIGSNVFNLLGILGTAGLILPLQVSAGMLASDVWWMLGTSALLLPLMYFGRRLSRLDGALLLTAYGAYLWLLL